MYVHMYYSGCLLVISFNFHLYWLVLSLPHIISFANAATLKSSHPCCSLDCNTAAILPVLLLVLYMYLYSMYPLPYCTCSYIANPTLSQPCQGVRVSEYNRCCYLTLNRTWGIVIQASETLAVKIKQTKSYPRRFCAQQSPYLLCSAA